MQWGLGAIRNKLVPLGKWQLNKDLREGKRSNGYSRGRRNSRYKGPEVGECLDHERSKSGDGTQGEEGEWQMRQRRQGTAHEGKTHMSVTQI